MSVLTDLMAVRPVASADPGAAGSSAPRGVYVTKESLTFTAANGVVLALLTVLNAFVPNASSDKLWMLGACVFVGLIIYLLSVTPTMTTWDKVHGRVDCSRQHIHPFRDRCRGTLTSPGKRWHGHSKS